MIDQILVKNRDEGQVKAHDLLRKLVDKNTLLAFSGGTTPDYRAIVVDPADIAPGAICVVDERYGEPFHRNSNEFLLKEAGVIDYCKRLGIEFYKYLWGKDLLETAGDYERIIEDLFRKYPKKVGIMGIGTNIHTAGIFPYSAAAKSPNYVTSETIEDKFPTRTTITMKALGEFTNFIILMFGQEKKDALRILLDTGVNEMQKYPAIFYRKVPIKSYLITDISV